MSQVLDANECSEAIAVARKFYEAAILMCGHIFTILMYAYIYLHTHIYIIPQVFDTKYVLTYAYIPYLRFSTPMIASKH